MNVRYLSCCVEEKQRGAVYLQKFSLCLELIVLEKLRERESIGRSEIGA
jgi:hypothetical protein